MFRSKSENDLQYTKKNIYTYFRKEVKSGESVDDIKKMLKTIEKYEKSKAERKEFKCINLSDEVLTKMREQNLKEARSYIKEQFKNVGLDNIKSDVDNYSSEKVLETISFLQKN